MRSWSSTIPATSTRFHTWSGPTALGYNVALVEAALGGPAPDSWALLFDPANAVRLADCGISVTDSPWMMAAMALLYLGRDPNSERPDDLRAAMDVLHGIRPFVRDICNAPITNQLAEGELCLAVAPGADFRLARDLARETDRNVELRFFVPREGGILWVDMLAIPADAAHPREAHALIDFLMRPEVIAKVTAETYLANANVPGTALAAPRPARRPGGLPGRRDARALAPQRCAVAGDSALPESRIRSFPQRPIAVRCDDSPRQPGHVEAMGPDRPRGHAATMRPSCRWIVRSASAAKCSSCVTITKALPVSRASPRISSNTR